MNNTNTEFKKISSAFRRVRDDNIALSNKILNLEEEFEYKINFLLKEIEMLRKDENLRLNFENSSKKKEENIYIGNITSRKVHISDCPYGKKITSENRKIFDELNDSLREGYTRCSCISSKN